MWAGGGGRRETLCDIQRKLVLSGTLEATSLQGSTEEGPRSEDSVFPPPVAPVKNTPRAQNSFHKPVFNVLSQCLARVSPSLFLHVVFTKLHRANSSTKDFVVTSCHVLLLHFLFFSLLFFFFFSIVCRLARTVWNFNYNQLKQQACKRGLYAVVRSQNFFRAELEDD